MFPRHWEYEIAILAVFCIVALFLFPVATGPYSAVHGPATALLSLRHRVELWLGMAMAALRLAPRMLSDRFLALRAALQKILPPRSVPPEQIAVLRC